MPLPFILIGAAVVAGGTGLVTGARGTMKINEAKEIISKAEKKYNEKKYILEESERKTKIALENLGGLKLNIWKNFERFSVAFEKIKNKPEFSDNLNEKFLFSKTELEEIKKISITAIDVLGTGLLSAGAGALVGVAAYGGTMALGVASTGTAIATLSGVAATNATLAALGGGSLAVGGGGMALGASVLTGAVAGPIVAVGGLLINAKGNDSIQKAYGVEKEVDEITVLMQSSLVYLDQLKEVSNKMEAELKKLFGLYEKQVGILEYLVNKEVDFFMYSNDEKRIVDNNIMLVKLLNKLTKVNLVEKVNNKDCVQINKVNGSVLESEKLRATIK
ncbi:hypothetical protein GH808_07415 [Acetobacterium fimetarium]|uniref:Uncharacterized protein n=1 Tax=Acetobacterium fimetarium TaxID=52691 RepID=A0ABR6WUK1_9FIRM|nr:hypothetical protein [Acetobacterium fimetarium]MBC3804260.1 hypothetical protein [Acetobacterium fimetarium]